MMKKAFAILILLSLLVVGCGGETAPPTEEATQPPTVEPIPSEEPEPEPLVFTDGKGRTIELEEYPSAIVTLGASIFESLFAMGAGDQVVGREEYTIYPEEAAQKVTNVGSLWGELPSEAIVALEPDLVIASELISDEQVSALEDLGLTVYWLGNPTDFEGLYANLNTLAALSGHEAEAQTLIDSIKTRVAAVEAVMAGVDERPTVFYELDATDVQNPYTTGAGTFIDTLITMAGGSNIGAVLDGEYAQMSSEEVIVQNPGVILLADAPYGISPESVGERPGWEVISAVVNDRVYPFDPYLVSVPGPRMVEGLEAMAKLLHPEMFE